ncbi:hypothetical protein EYF80_046597 [Liparis tanakae]|uniref:Uncharacterized protein n=1 Tax=Liparis tanakae TaxID=230148 RepID=A0A4Z2FQ05_9TELE|nr:hypothetical protein EYF80_046597 [Liparis tanakae]
MEDHHRSSGLRPAGPHARLRPRGARFVPGCASSFTGPGVRAPESSEFTDPLTEGLQLLGELLVALHRLTAALAAGAVAEVGGAVEPAELGVAAPAQVVALLGLVQVQSLVVKGTCNQG